MPTHVTEKYGTVQARIPIDLLEAVQRYAAMHRLRVSELIRDGLQWRIEQEVPGILWTPSAAHDSGEEGVTPADLLHVIQSLQSTLQTIHADVRHIRQTTEARQIDHTLSVRHVRHVGDDTQHVPPDRPVDVRHVRHDIQGANFDPTKFYLADLCKRGHDYQGTGKSLLRKGNSNCVQCQRELRQARDARRTAAAREG